MGECVLQGPVFEGSGHTSPRLNCRRPYYPEIGLSGGSVIVVKHSAEMTLLSNGSMPNGGASPRNDEQIADALVISLGVIVRDEFADGLS